MEEKRLVTAMAFSRSKAESVITAQSEHMSAHVLKVLSFPHASFVKGWTKEIRASYVRCGFYGQNLSGGKKCKFEDYWQWLYVPPFRREPLIIEIRDLEIAINDKIKPRILDEHETITRVKNFYHALCEALSRDVEWTQFAPTMEILTR